MNKPFSSGFMHPNRHEDMNYIFNKPTKAIYLLKHVSVTNTGFSSAGGSFQIAPFPESAGGFLALQQPHQPPSSTAPCHQAQGGARTQQQQVPLDMGGCVSPGSPGRTGQSSSPGAAQIPTSQSNGERSYPCTFPSRQGRGSPSFPPPVKHNAEVTRYPPSSQQSVGTQRCT